MKVYIGFTAVLFALLTLLHVWRMIAESTSVSKNPWLVLITLASAALCVWAVLLLSAGRKSGSTT